jgi:hypothetical protein
MRWQFGGSNKHKLFPSIHSTELDSTRTAAAHQLTDRFDLFDVRTWIKLDRKSERQYVPKVTPTALAKVGAVAERDMVSNLGLVFIIGRWLVLQFGLLYSLARLAT